MLYIADKKVDFELAGVRYVAEPGSGIDIPDRLAYCIKGRGLPLKPEHGEQPDKVVRGVKLAPVRPPKPRDPDAPTMAEHREGIADVTGEDPFEDPADDPGDTEELAASAEASMRKPSRRGK